MAARVLHMKDGPKVGLHFINQQYQAKGWYDSKTGRALAMDGSPISNTPNTNVPAYAGYYIDTRVVRTLTAPRTADQIFERRQWGSWATPYSSFKILDGSADIAPYDDYAQNRNSSTNYEFPVVDHFRYQTTIRWGDLENEMHGLAQIDFIGDLQNQAAQALAIASNQFSLLGVDGYNIYGIFNNPNLGQAIPPLPGAGGSFEWADKTALEIYNDILELYNALAANSAGLITNTNTNIVMSLPPSYSGYLGRTTDLGVSVMAMLNEFFKGNLTLVYTPELEPGTAGATIFMTARRVGEDNAQVGILPYGALAFPSRIESHTTWSEQKWMASTYGAVPFYPFAIAQMTGV